MNDPSSNVNLIRSAYGAFSRGDVPGVLNILHEDVEWHEAEGFPYGGTYHGHAEVLDNVFMKLGTEWEDFRALDDEYVDGGDTIVVLGHYKGAYKETGESMEAPFAHVWKIGDGKVQEFRQYTDTVLVQRALEGG